MANYLTLDDVQVKEKIVFVRVDFNSEVDPVTKKVSSDVRIRAHGETTINELAEKGAGLMEGIFTGSGANHLMDEMRAGAQGCCPGADLVDVYGRVFDFYQAGEEAQAQALFDGLAPMRGLKLDAHWMLLMKERLRRRGVFASTRSRVSGATRPPDRKARDTVITLSPHASEISLNVASFVPPFAIPPPDRTHRLTYRVLMSMANIPFGVRRLDAAFTAWVTPRAPCLSTPKPAQQFRIDKGSRQRKPIKVLCSPFACQAVARRA